MKRIADFRKVLMVLSGIILGISSVFAAGRAPLNEADISIYKELSNVERSIRKVPVKRVVPVSNFIEKHYAQKDNMLSGWTGNYFTGMTKFSGTAQDLKIENFAGMGFVASGSYDESTGIITLPSQFAFNESPFGDFWLCYYDVERGGFSSSLPITIKVNEDGTMTSETAWVIVVPDRNSAYYGSGLGLSAQATFYASNATMTGRQRDVSAKTFLDSSSYPLYVYQPADDQLVVANFATNGKEVTLLLSPNGNVTVEPQVIVNSSLVGPSNTYPATWSATQNKGTNANLTATADSNSVTFGPWGVFRASSLTVCSFGMESSVLTLSEGMSLKFPSNEAVSFKGTGSESDPYLIETMQDLINLAKGVNTQAQKYTGKFFKQTSDIDFAGSTATYRPIGLSATAYFDGTYDGNGKSISHLTIDRGGSDYTGLFGYAGANSTIKNVNVVGCKLTTHGKYCGGVIGNMLGRIENCHASATIYTDKDYAGGIAGSGKKTTNCSFFGTMTTMAYAGGILGNLASDTIRNCSVEAVIKSYIPSTSIPHAVGGVVGQLGGSKSGTVVKTGLIEDCSFLGSISDNTGYAHVGGIAGSISSYSLINRCTAAGMLQTSLTSNSTASCGGIAGLNSSGTITNCFATNSIQAKNNTVKCGGLVGLVWTSAASPAYVGSSLFAGQILGGGEFLPDCSIYGKLDPGITVENVYFDSQMMSVDTQGYGRATNVLVSGEALPGMDSDNWIFQQGRYPSVKGTAKEIANFTNTPVLLTPGQNALNVKNDFSVTPAENIQWSLYDSTYLMETSLLKMEGNNVSLKSDLGLAFVAARMSNEHGTFVRLHTLNIAPAQFSGSGTSEDPYQVKTLEDLRKMNNAITQSSQYYDGDFFILANDIDLKGVKDFWGIGDDGNSSHVFNGTFDGNNHKILNWSADGITLDADGKVVSSSSRSTIGFFGSIGPKGVVKNLTIGEGTELRGYAGVGSVAAICSGTVENCRNYGNITIANFYVGGIVCRLNTGGMVKGCYNAGRVTSGSKYAGGIVSDAKEGSVIELCQNDGTVMTAKVTNSVALEDTQYAAGIAAVTNSTKIINCVNGGSIQSIKYCGGIIAGYGSTCEIRGCLNTGVVNVPRPADRAGAVVGYCSSVLGMSDTYYDSQIVTVGGAQGVELDGIAGLRTSELISGKVLAGLPDNIYNYQANAYPVLEIFKDLESAETLRHMYLLLEGDDDLREVTSSVGLSQYAGNVWEMAEGSTELFAISDNKLNIGNLSAPLVATVSVKNKTYERSFSFTAVNNPFQGKGTLEAPFLISTVDDFKNLLKYTNEYGVRYGGKYFSQTADLDFKNEPVIPIAYGGDLRFDGSYDGKENKILNYSQALNEKTDGYTGVFGNVGDKGCLRNINLKSGSLEGYKYAAGVVGNLLGVIENCVNGADVKSTGNTNAGGLIAYSAGKARITRCVNEGNVSGYNTHVGGVASYVGSEVIVDSCINRGVVSAATGKNTAGGIAAVSAGKILNSINEGTVSGNAYIGGIAASYLCTDSMTNCINKGIIKAESTYAAGIAAEFSGKGKNLRNYSPIKANGYVGGLIASMKTGATLENSANYADVEGIKTANVGGVVAYSSGVIDSVANYCKTVKGASSVVGGIVGYMSGNASTTMNCVNHADVIATGTAAYRVGGIVGYCASTVSGCINHGTVSSESYSTGGIGGEAAGKVSKCINFGAVSTTYDLDSKKYGNAGGIWGHGASTITDCINYGDVTAKRYAAGLLGYPATASQLSSCYFSGKLTSGDANTTGAILHTDATFTKVAVEKCYYNSDLNGDLVQSEEAAKFGDAKSALELRSAALSESFELHNHAMPTLAHHSDVAEANYHAAMIVFNGEENSSDFRTYANIEILPGLEWTSTPNIVIEGNKLTAAATQKGEKGIVSLKGGKYSRDIELVLNNETSGVNGCDQADMPIATRWFTLDGLEILNPEKGTIAVKRDVMPDGSVKVSKIVVK